MAFIPTPDTVQARLQFQEDSGVVAENIFYHATAGVPTLAELETIGGLWQDWVIEDWAPLSSINWKCIGVALRALNEEEGIAINYNAGFPVTGTNVGAPTPLQVTYTVTWSTGLVGRSARGRTYGVGVTAGEIEDNTRLKDIARAAFQINWDALRALMETNGHALQVVSFQEGGVPRVAGRPLPVLSTNVRFPLATQRRRLS